MRKIIKNKSLFVLFIIFCLFGVSSLIFAAEIAWPDSPGGTKIVDASGNITATLTDLIKYLYEWGITLGGLAAFVSLVIAGFQYLTSVGNPQTMKDAMARIKSAVFGLILLLASWLILNTINPDLTTLKPISFSTSTISNACDTENNCPSNLCDTPNNCGSPDDYTCSDANPGNGNKEGICNPLIDKCFNDTHPGDGIKDGICVPNLQDTTPQPCDKIVIYSQANFQPLPGYDLLPGHTYNITISNTPASSQGYLNNEVNNACMGALELYGHSNCSDYMTTLGVTNKSIMVNGQDSTMR